MSWLDSAQVNLLGRYLDLSTRRQSLITSNIANVDTPGYHAKDVDFQGELQRALHGNNVSVDRESLLLSEVQMQFGIAEQLLKSQFRNVRLAINEGNSSI